LSAKKKEKSSLSNNPAVAVIFYLYQATNDYKYLDYAIKVYNLVKEKITKMMELYMSNLIVKELIEMILVFIIKELLLKEPLFFINLQVIKII